MDRYIATFGYTLAGSITGYCFGSLTMNEGKWTLIGSMAGLSMGLIKQYRVSSIITEKDKDGQTKVTTTQGQVSNNQSLIKTVFVGFFILKMAVPITCIGLPLLLLLATK